MNKLNLFLLLFVLTGINLSAQILIPFGSEWKYLDNGSNQGVAWTTTSFDDSNWKIGKGKFGYGEGNEATIINYGPDPKKKYVTTYIRKTVYSNDPSLYSSFTTDIKRDDGVVVYLNGVELYRDNMPSGPISYNTFAERADDGDKSIKSFTTGSDLIVKGANVIAVEIHQYTHSSSDMSFDMQVTGHISPGNSTLVPFGSDWKYLDNGSDQGNDWTAISFDESNWKSGKAKLGYGEGDEATLIDYGPNAKKKYITTYFRKTISANYPSFYSSFVSEVKRDDGVVVYLNGVEVYRDNMPSGAISYNTLATSANDDKKSIKSFTITPDLFVKGTNVIAVEIHQYSQGSADLSFDLQMTGKVAEDNPNLIPFGSTWKYLDDGSDQGTSWTGLYFADGKWKTGAAVLGYGNRNERTEVSYGQDPDNKCITTYFRKIISISNPGEFKKYSFIVKRDDGIVVYINGKEVYRNNMPNGPISYTTLALGSVDENALLKTFNIGASAFITGVNVIAVEIHQANPTSTDISFDLNLAGASDTPEKIRIMSGPDVTVTDQNEVLIQWKTNIATDSKLEVGTTYGNYTLSAFDANISAQHQVKLGGLLPSTKYFYRLGSTTEWFLGSVTDFFTTNPTEVTLSAKTGNSLAENNETEKEVSNLYPGRGQNNIKVLPTLVARGKVITIRSNVNEPIEASIFNMNGSFIRSLKVSKTTSLETNNLSAGTYVIVSKSKGKVNANRFVVIN